MSSTSDTIPYNTARECPKCSVLGENRNTIPAPKAANLPKGTFIHNIYCVNERCKWYNTPWTVQVNPDGTVPAPKDHTRQPKVYGGIAGHNDEARHLIETLKRAAAAETTPGAEVRGRY